MRRRAFIAGFGAAAAWPVVASAQRSAMPVIGLLSGASLERSAGRLRAFRQGLTDGGYVEGETLAIEYRWADGRHDQFPALATDLVRRQVAVIVATDAGAAFAAKQATTTAPIVFRLGIDPVAAGLVASLNRPGGNVTGVTTLAVELGAKLLEVLRELVPTATAFALLANPTYPNSVALANDLPKAARSLGLEFHTVHASSEDDFEVAFARAVSLRVGGLILAPELLFTNQSAKLAAMAIRHALPTIYYFRDFVEAGGLISYGNSIADSYRLAGVYAGRILKGEKPGDLPVQQVTKIEMSVNLKTAKALGLSMPAALLARADEVIE